MPASDSARTPTTSTLWQRASVTDLHNGTYAVEYTVQKAGPYLIKVQLGGVHIMGSQSDPWKPHDRSSVKLSSTSASSESSSHPK